MAEGNLWAKFHILEPQVRSAVVFPSQSMKTPKKIFLWSPCNGGKLSLHSEASKMEHCVRAMERKVYRVDIFYNEQRKYKFA